MAPDPVTQERIYEAIKEDFLAGLMRPEVRIEIQALADRHRTSTTPVREVLHRLIGERLIEPRSEGGLRLAIPDTERLSALYAWNRQMMLAALQMASTASVRDTLKSFRRMEVHHDRLSLVRFVDTLFQAIGDAAGNRECAEQIQNVSERLHYPRLAEAHLFADFATEAQMLVRNGHLDVRRAVGRRLRDYHERRIRNVSRIAGAISQLS
jgi:DNA-binding GntR family transcriptional regulator